MLRKFLVWLLELLHDWTARWLGRISPSPGSSPRPRASRARPPEHWLKLVRDRAPQLLDASNEEFSFGVELAEQGQRLPTGFPASTPPRRPVQAIAPPSSSRTSQTELEANLSMTFRRRWLHKENSDARLLRVDPSIAEPSPAHSTLPPGEPFIEPSKSAALFEASRAQNAALIREQAKENGRELQKPMRPGSSEKPPLTASEVRTRSAEPFSRSNEPDLVWDALNEEAVEPRIQHVGQVASTWPVLEDSVHESAKAPHLRSAAADSEFDSEETLQWPELDRRPLRPDFEPRLKTDTHRHKADAEQRGTRWNG